MMFRSLFCLAAAAVGADMTIVETAAGVPSLSTLVSVLSLPGYESVLKALDSPGNFTVFAPNNDAFTAAGVDPSDVRTVTQVLYYHVLGERVRSTDLAPLQFPATLMTDASFVNMGGSGQVLDVASDSSGVSVNTGKVLTADVECSNGVVHIVDTVLEFPTDVIAIAQAAGLTELASAISVAGLSNTLRTTASTTVFAPTNEAMIAANWMSLDRATLTAVLTYHVVPAVAYSTDLTDGEVLTTLNGDSLKVDLSAGVKINDANVAVANVLTQSGVVHVIDKVLIPAM